MMLPLSAVTMATQPGHHLRLVGWMPIARDVGLDVLIEQFVMVQHKAVAGQPNRAQALGIFCGERPSRYRPMHGAPVKNQVDFALGVLEHMPHELEERWILELTLKHHESERTTIGDRRDHVAAKTLPIESRLNT